MQWPVKKFEVTLTCLKLPCSLSITETATMGIGAMEHKATIHPMPMDHVGYTYLSYVIAVWLISMNNKSATMVIGVIKHQHSFHQIEGVFFVIKFMSRRKRSTPEIQWEHI